MAYPVTILFPSDRKPKKEYFKMYEQVSIKDDSTIWGYSIVQVVGKDGDKFILKYPDGRKIKLSKSKLIKRG